MALKATWYSQACFLIEADQTKILIYEAYRRGRY